MNNYIGSRKQVDEYIGNRVVVAGYQGSRKYFDAFNTVSGAPPLVFNSRVQQVLRNYTVYGSSEGAGVKTENLFSGKGITQNIGAVTNISESVFRHIPI